MSQVTNDEPSPRSLQPGEFLRALSDAARSQPVPSALVAMGAIWLFSRTSGDAIGKAARSLRVGDTSIEAGRAKSLAAAGHEQAVGEKLADATRTAQRSVSDLLEAQPLLAGAVGFAIGAGLGALFPSTTIEAEILGPQTERLAAQAKSFIADQASQAQHG